MHCYYHEIVKIVKFISKNDFKNCKLAIEGVFAIMLFNHQGLSKVMLFKRILSLKQSMEPYFIYPPVQHTDISSYNFNLISSWDISANMDLKGYIYAVTIWFTLNTKDLFWIPSSILTGYLYSPTHTT